MTIGRNVVGVVGDGVEGLGDNSSLDFVLSRSRDEDDILEAATKGYFVLSGVPEFRRDVAGDDDLF